MAELARCLDLPVAIEHRLDKDHPGAVPFGHDLRFAFPIKILMHALWLAGFGQIQGGGTLHV